MRTLYAISILALALCLGGCTAAERITDEGPTLDRHGRLRSLALDSRPMRKLDTEYASAWWTTRNDLARGTYVPQDGLVYDLTEVRTWDRLYDTDGRVHDHFHQTTYNRRLRQQTP